MLKTLSFLEQAGIDYFTSRFGESWLDGVLDEVYDLVEGERARGFDDGQVLMRIGGALHDQFRHTNEPMYYASRGVLRAVVHATSRDTAGVG